MSLEPARRKQNIACLTCKRRKVRCDLVLLTELPCTPCRRGELQCVPNDKGPSSNRPSTPRRRNSKLSISKVTNGAIDRVLPSEIAPTRTPTPERSPAQTKKPETTTSLSNFLEQGIKTSNWKLFSGTDPTRIVYVGTPIGNLAALVGNEDPANSVTRHYPFPANKPPLPWKPKPGSLPFAISPELLQDVGSVPTQEVRDALVNAYFAHINPGFPIINEPHFRSQYASPKNPPPLILLQCVLLAGAHVSTHPLVAAARPTVKNTLYRRALELFHLRYENDRLYLVQAALLFTWHQENADEVSCNTWMWTGIASRIAFGLGANRDLSPHASVPMPIWDRRRYRFAWWTLFVTEAFAALHYGRACTIRWEDFDVPDLITEDYRDHEENPDPTIRRDCFELNVALAYIAQDAMRLFAPRASLMQQQTSLAQSLNSRLAALAVSLPTGDDTFSCQVRLNYHLVLLHCHRTNRNQYADEAKRSEGLKVRSEAASAMLSILEIMEAKDYIRQAHFPIMTVLMAVVVQFLEDIKLAIEASSIILASGAHAKLGRVISPGKEITKYWPNADAILKMCQGQWEKFGAVIQGYVSESSPHEPMGFGTGGQGDGGEEGFWKDLFSAYNDGGIDFGVGGAGMEYGWMTTGSNYNPLS
ncbi:Acetamidase regulatory protein [Cyphellophora attinorum]|uniref:Acetamidase regulatory protein n=1 Tax=Cyphellophora attinorum TaxID=1664694 RepID=A0A0N1H6L7_9EURO|nr:Acetamidase regulatory protein [Phialophora attinorum]KPI37033.1 Acetamidase regulatory protein [Phialophora attinorum]